MGSSRGAWATDPNIAHATAFVPQGVSADLLATLDGTTREACDRYAAQSQTRCQNARQQGRQNAREDAEEEASARPAAATSDRTEEEHHHIDVTI